MNAYYSKFNHWLDAIAFVYSNSKTSGTFKSFTKKQAKERRAYVVERIIKHLGYNALHSRLVQVNMVIGTAQKTIKKNSKIPKEQVEKLTRKFERLSDDRRKEIDARAVRYILMVALVGSQWSSFHKTKEYGDIFLVEDSMMAPDQMVLHRVLVITEKTKQDIGGLLIDLDEGTEDYIYNNCPRSKNKQVDELTDDEMQLMNRFLCEDYYDEYQYE